MKQRCDADRWSPEGERRSPSEDEADEKVSAAEIYNAEDYKEIFQPKNAICTCNDVMAPGWPSLITLTGAFPSHSSDATQGVGTVSRSSRRR